MCLITNTQVSQMDTLPCFKWSYHNFNNSWSNQFDQTLSLVNKNDVVAQWESGYFSAAVG